MRKTLFILIAIALILGVSQYKTAEDKSGWYFPDHNPGIMLTPKFAREESSHTADGVTNQPWVARIGDEVIITVPVMVAQDFQLENRLSTASYSRV
jgi:hypothetical protein